MHVTPQDLAANLARQTAATMSRTTLVYPDAELRSVAHVNNTADFALLLDDNTRVVIRATFEVLP